MLNRPIVSMPRQACRIWPKSRQTLFAQLLATNRFVLSMALLLAIELPALVHPLLADFGRWFVREAEGDKASLLGAAAALVGAHLALQQMGSLPLIQSRTLILPAFFTTFSGVIVLLYAARVPLEPYHFWTAFLIGAVWYLVVSVLRARMIRPIIGLIGVPDDFGSDLPGNVVWIGLTDPEIDYRLDAVVVDPHASLDLPWSSFITRLVLDGIPVYHRTHIEEGLTGRTHFERHADNNFGALLPSLLYLRIKRGIDLLAVAPLGLLVLAALAVAAVAIKLDSPGPVLFRQTRMGFRGRPFTCYKLRTMRVDAGGPAYTRANDDRITRVGRPLRKWRIDELPQIYNVFKGDLSWIGPRPEALSLAQAYAAEVPFYDYRHAVRPGISGWAAVHQGNVALVDAARIKLEYDFYYIRYFSIWLDLLILLKTAQTIISGFGSR
ncbi:sugar transferase [Novosphingobium album (ex Liu et al. 2023)]|uniref:Sugar transferase n=1 Tax=Novosphingobium album (ex Liu et al. 2023) TaxID=3031130 RepID=A0ABT5WSH7_9SPHN|nr:sugar transferase [Novosphingobium album (ex Liu et al. 2023)]MDE8653001.1 sugar transferase [Novosphingobium album (ex Liu et al. 2023)]